MYLLEIERTNRLNKGVYVPATVYRLWSLSEPRSAKALIGETTQFGNHPTVQIANGEPSAVIRIEDASD